MKKTLRVCFFGFLTLLFAAPAFAQNYQPFRKGLTYHFMAQDSIYSLRVDSVKVVNGDSVFVFNQTTKELNSTVNNPACTPANFYGSYAIRSQNQFGKQMTKKPNGEFVFRTLQGQEFLLKTKASVGQTWVVNTTNNLTAILSQKFIGTVAPGIQDSIFLYNFNTGGQIQLSKKYGFFSTINFASFSDPTFTPKTLNFYKLPEKQIGSPISSPFSVHNFQVGDKFMLHKRNYTGILGNNICTEQWNQIRILSRRNSVNNDTIYYTLERQQLYKAYGNAGAPAPFCNQATATTLNPAVTENLAITANTNSETFSLSNSFKVFQQTGPLNGMVSKGIIRTSLFNQREQLLFHQVPYLACAKTFTFMVDYSRKLNYAVGLGRTYEEISSTNGSSIEELIAYIKGNETYGTWLSLGQLMTIKKEVATFPGKIYPNPCISEITLQFSEPVKGNQVEISVLNTFGQVVSKTVAVAGKKELQLNLEQLPKGIYVVQVNQNGKVYSSRLVKE
jgi:hypothetical protein